VRRQLIAPCTGFRIPAHDDSLNAITRLALRELAQRIQTLEAQLDRIVTRLRRITTTAAPDLLDRPGVGPDTAATLLITAGDNPDRLHHQRSFASLCGSSPVPANSGQTQNRHRLNRGGDRQANNALWRIALCRMKTHAPTRDYVTRRTAEGLSKLEIIRCLKRYIARDLYRILVPEIAVNDLALAG
jgi:transposase